MLMVAYMIRLLILIHGKDTRASEATLSIQGGMSPKLDRERESLDAFLADIDGTSLPPIPITTPAVANDNNSVL